MPRRLCVPALCCVLAFSLLTARSGGVEIAPSAPNSDPVYQQLRNIGLSSEAVTVNNFDLKRDAAIFHLRSGTVCFVAPVQGRVTGAVFVGDGNLVLEPPSFTEKQMLRLLTKADEFSETFSQMVLRFTDSTYDEIKKAGTAGSPACDPGLLKESQNTTRHKLKENLEARILQDVLSPEAGAFFRAFVHGKRYNGKELFTVDPHGALDQVEFMTYDDNKYGVWAAFPMSSESGKSARRNPIHIEHQQLDTTIEKNAQLTGKATTTLVSRVNGLRVVPFDLYRTLRVQSVSGEGGQQPLAFIQENKNDDADFSVVLPKALAADEKYTLTITYAGKEAVSNEGGGNYYPVARDNWYPNNPFAVLGEYTSYDMIFRVPKGMKLAATGSLVRESNDGGQNVTVWKSEVPQTVAGFNFGRFKVEEAKLSKPEYLVQSFANEEKPDWVSSLGSGEPGTALGSLGTTGLNKKALAEGQLAVQLYSDYFGPSSYKRLALTQQTACNYGQSWPELVWIPLCYFFDTTVRHQLGLDSDLGYWKVVTPHEVAHQWWGHTVGFSSYRDQWMSEGFSDMSASLFLQMIEKNPRKFVDFWNDERESLVQRNKEGFRAIDAGPVTLGYRLSNSRSGFDITRRLIYPKGAYILHMVRMMMYDRRSGDQLFKETMQDFVKTYANQAASTEDFKGMVEKHMTVEMDLDGNHRLDWFFNEYVYGTALPSYKLDYSFDKGTDGMVLNLKLAQSGVDDHFKMLVPIYLEMSNGRLLSLGRAPMTGNTTIEQKVPLKGLNEIPKRAVVNYFADVLAGN